MQALIAGNPTAALDAAVAKFLTEAAAAQLTRNIAVVGISGLRNVTPGIAQLISDAGTKISYEHTRTDFRYQIPAGRNSVSPLEQERQRSQAAADSVAKIVAHLTGVANEIEATLERAENSITRALFTRPDEMDAVAFETFAASYRNEIRSMIGEYTGNSIGQQLAKIVGRLCRTSNLVPAIIGNHDGWLSMVVEERYGWSWDTYGHELYSAMLENLGPGRALDALKVHVLLGQPARTHNGAPFVRSFVGVRSSAAHAAAELRTYAQLWIPRAAGVPTT